MALPLSNTAEYGLADATALTAGNSASPNAFDVFAGTAEAKTTDFQHGAGSIGITQGATVAATYVSWTTALGTITTLGGRFYLKIPGTRAASSVRLIRFISGSTVISAIVLSTTGALQWATGTGDTANGTAANSLIPVSTWVRVEFDMTFGASVGVGVNKIRWFTGDSTTQNGADATNAAAANFGASATGLRIGNASGNGVASSTTFLDDIALQSSGFPGPSGGGGAVAVQPQLMLVGAGS